jgi:hypothetical protein|tara:strand:+ start:57 stop:317 length:261 start_codon:yes stop_codon:yes gene_type:complete
MTKEEIRKEICRIFMEDDDFDIYMREWRDRKKGLTSGAFDNAVKKDWMKQDEPTRRQWKRIAQSRVGRIMTRAEELLDAVCKGVFP